MQCHLTKHTLFDRIRFVCSKDMVTQQPSSGELRLCELSQEPQMCELNEGRRGAPKLRHGVNCSILDYCEHISDVQHIIDQPYNAILLLKAEVYARQVIYRCCMYICSRGPANPGHLCVCGVACSVQLSSGCRVNVLGCAVRGRGGGGPAATAVGHNLFPLSVASCRQKCTLVVLLPAHHRQPGQSTQLRHTFHCHASHMLQHSNSNTAD